jgi:hypothetical protein
MPADRDLDWFSASEILDWHKLPAGTPHTIFPVRRPHLVLGVTDLEHGWPSSRR